MNNNIVLIGMATVGKSYLGRTLAKKLNIPFIDTDDLIEAETGQNIGDLPNILGDDDFMMLEGNIVSELVTKEPTVIATGGSVIYSPEAMDALQSHATIIHIEADFPYVQERMDARGVFSLVGQNGKSLEDLYSERLSLYTRYADHTISRIEHENEQSVEALYQLVKKHNL